MPRQWPGILEGSGLSRNAQRLSLNDQFVTEFVLIVRGTRKVLGQNLTATLDYFAVGSASVAGF
jgi:hypothetical protein